MTEHDGPQPEEPTDTQPNYQQLWQQARAEQLDDFGDDEDDVWLEEDSRDPAAERDLDMQDKFVNGWEPMQLEDGTYLLGDSQESVAEFQDWLTSLLPQRRSRLQAERDEVLAQWAQTESGKNVAEARLKIQAPELLAGTLPADMAEKMPGPFALGINQSVEGGADEAQAYLEAEHGLPLLNYGPIQRFEFVDQTTNEETRRHKITGGYYNNPDIGRFIVAFPIIGATGRTAEAPAAEVSISNNLPEDFYNSVAGPHGPSSAVNPKYVAGFIDGEGNWHRNRQFGEGLDLGVEAAETDWV
jgi:hypothetical protein